VLNQISFLSNVQTWQALSSSLCLSRAIRPAFSMARFESLLGPLYAAKLLMEDACPNRSCLMADVSHMVARAKKYARTPSC